jgi:hypothetical protein
MSARLNFQFLSASSMRSRKRFRCSKDLSLGQRLYPCEAGPAEFLKLVSLISWEEFYQRQSTALHTRNSCYQEFRLKIAIGKSRFRSSEGTLELIGWDGFSATCPRRPLGRSVAAERTLLPISAKFLDLSMQGKTPSRRNAGLSELRNPALWSRVPLWIRRAQVAMNLNRSM